MRTLVSALLVGAALAAPASGAPLATPPPLPSGYYVDAVNGDDANGGTSPADAWRTLTHAASSYEVRTYGGTIHVAPGTYDQALGEVFPIVVFPYVSIVSDAGTAATVVDGGGTTAELFSLHEGGIRLEGLALRTAGRGVFVQTVGASYSVDLVDLDVTGMTEWGILAYATHGLQIRLERVRCTGNGRGLDILLYGGASSQVDVVDCEFSDNAGPGAGFSGYSPEAVATFDSCRIERNGSVGVHVAGQGFYGDDKTMRLVGCVVADNAGAGGQAFGDSDGASGRLEAVRTTFARNGGGGVVRGPGGVVVLDSCILAGHTLDLAPVGVAAVRYSLIHDRTFEGVEGNIGGFPRFVDPDGGDYRLQPDSPCIDAGNPELPLDPDCTRADMGAFFVDQGGPATYCTGKPNSLGCVPFLATAGATSASGTASFRVEAHDVLPDQAGVLLYGYAPGHLAFHGGTLCVKAPLRRLAATPAKQTGPPPCPGVLSRDFNQVVQSGSDSLLTAGQTVFAQWLQRDPADPAGFGDGLTDAVRFALCP